MGFLTPMKANKAYRLQQKGQKEEARKLYEEAFSEGLDDPRYNLAYALMIIREGEYQKAKEFLVKHQKAPGMTQDQRVTLLVDYAACCFRLGDIDKAINTLEQQFRKTETGLIYQTLGYLYVEKYDPANKPDSEDWDAGVEKAEAFINQSLEYDDADAICLDNKGQFLYRVKGDKAAAKEWFDKAYAIKDRQIDTLYFLSRYDEEAGDKEAALEKLEKAAAGRFSPLNYCSRDTVLKEIERLKGAN